MVPSKTDVARRKFRGYKYAFFSKQRNRIREMCRVLKEYIKLSFSVGVNEERCFLGPKSLPSTRWD